MAEMKKKRLVFTKRLEEALREGLAKGGVSADVSAEKIPSTKLHRALVVSPQFEKLRPSERQDLIWRIVQQHFSPDQQLQISMIVTLAPSEISPRRSRDDAVYRLARKLAAEVGLDSV